MDRLQEVLINSKTVLSSLIRRRAFKFVLVAFILISVLHNLSLNHYEQALGKQNIDKIKEYYNVFGTKSYEQFWFSPYPYNIDLSKEKVVDPKRKAVELLNPDGLVNLKYLKHFKYHEDLTPAEVMKKNDQLYDKVMAHKINEPRVGNLKRPSLDYERANATIMCLVRESELEGLISSMKQVEDKFNKKFRYPWTLMNNRPFTEDFKLRISKETDAEIHFVEIPSSLWDVPASVDVRKMKKGMKALAAQKLPYATMTSYRNMCRFNSGNFYQVPHMKQFKYYWRVEPSVSYYCDIDYDLFQFMEDNDKVYGFVATLYEIAETIPTLWKTTMDFVQKHPQYLNPNGAYDFLLNDIQLPAKHKLAQGYSTCHFWSNFEIGNMDFFRGEAYTNWFNALDEAGGFYYERWGDAPVHSIGVGLFADKSKVHWFRDIGYRHPPYQHCPTSDKCGGCKAGVFTEFDDVQDQNCNPHWIRYAMTESDLEMY